MARPKSCGPTTATTEVGGRATTVARAVTAETMAAATAIRVVIGRMAAPTTAGATIIEARTAPTTAGATIIRRGAIGAEAALRNGSNGLAFQPRHSIRLNRRALRQRTAPRMRALHPARSPTSTCDQRSRTAQRGTPSSARSWADRRVGRASARSIRRCCRESEI